MKTTKPVRIALVLGALACVTLSPGGAGARINYKEMAGKITDGFKTSIAEASARIKEAASRAVDELKRTFLDEIVKQTFLDWLASAVTGQKLSAQGGQVLQDVGILERSADAYHEAVDGLLAGDGSKVQGALLKLQAPIAVVQRFNLKALADALLARIRETVQPLVTMKARALMETAYQAVEPIIAKAKKVATPLLLALTALMPIAGKLGILVATVVDEVIKMLHLQIMPFLAQQVGWLARQVLEAVGAQLVDITGRIDATVGPVRDKVMKFLAAKLPSLASALGEVTSKVADRIRQAQAVLSGLKK